MKRDTYRLGMAQIWVVAALLVLVGFVGLACDTTYVFLTAQKLQIAADGSALAGAAFIPEDTTGARAAAMDFAQANSAGAAPVQIDANWDNDPNGDIVLGQFDRETGVFIESQEDINAVKVVCRRGNSAPAGPLPLFFGPAFGVDSVQLGRSAIASFSRQGVGLLVLDETEARAVDIQGNVFIDMPGGPIHVNSEHRFAFWIRFSPDASTNAPKVSVTGQAFTMGNANFDPFLHTAEPSFPDPLGEHPHPTWNPADDLGAITVSSGSVEIEPGYYSGGITATGGDLELRPGVYILGGAGLTISGSVQIHADQVMLYLTDGGSFNLDLDPEGDGSFAISPSSNKEDPHWGISVFQARGNTNSASILGHEGLNLEGTLYFPDNHLTVVAASNGALIGNQIIANRVEIDGQGIISIDYDGRFAQPGGKVLLVK